MSDVTSAEVVSFWREAGPERWFEHSRAVPHELNFQTVVSPPGAVYHMRRIITGASLSSG
jgi:hypothetical protein